MLEEVEIKELKSRLKRKFSDYYEIAGGKNYRYHHLVSVHRYARQLMDAKEIAELEFDPVVVEVAALFHDIGRSEDIEDGYLDPFENHSGHDSRGKEMVSELVEDFVNEKQLERIEEVIGNHHSEPETVEDKIIQDADLLFKYGIHDMWRQFHYASENGRELPETWEYFREELRQKLEDKLENFHFEKTREVAEERMEKEVEALSRFRKEVKGEDII